MHQKRKKRKKKVACESLWPEGKGEKADDLPVRQRNKVRALDLSLGQRKKVMTDHLPVGQRKKVTVVDSPVGQREKVAGEAVGNCQ